MPRSVITRQSGVGSRQSFVSRRQSFVGSRQSTTVLVFVTLLVTSPQLLSAQRPVPGDWSVVDAQPTGAALVVEVIGGEEMTGTLVQAREIDLEIALADGHSRAVPKSAVVEVRTRARVGDPLKNGMTYGGLIGAAAMGAFVGFLFSICESTCDAPRVGTVLIPALALGAGAGIGGGAAVDAAIRGPLILYRRAGS